MFATLCYLKIFKDGFLKIFKNPIRKAKQQQQKGISLNCSIWSTNDSILAKLYPNCSSESLIMKLKLK